MKLTKYSHSCVRLEKDGRAITLDPGVYSEAEVAMDGVEAILITHEHPDHIDQAAVLAALAADPALLVHAPAGVAATLRQAAPESAGQIHDAAADSAFEVAGFAVRSFGGQHALIHGMIPVVANVAYLIEENVYHPGDSLVVPDGLAVNTLLLPIHAPWSKISEIIDFTISVRAPKAFQIHDALLNQDGVGLIEANIQRFAKRYGTDYSHLAPGESVEV